MNQKTQQGWFRFVIPLVILAVAVSTSLWGTNPRLVHDRIIHFFSHDPATASPAGVRSEVTCTEPCCAGEEKAAPAKACYPNCTVTDLDKDTLSPPQERGACCPPTHPETPTGMASGNIIWTQALVQEFKSKGDWCTTHGVPESMCVSCNPALVEEFKARGDWCQGHNLPESLCMICNKELAVLGIGRDWFEEHGLPESQCTLCNPKRLGQVLPTSPFGLVRNETATLEAETAGQAISAALTDTASIYDKSQRQGINPDCPLHHVKIHLSNPAVAQEAGLQTEPAGIQSISQSLRCYGTVQYDRTHYAVLSPPASGIVDSVSVSLGDHVARGDVLAVINSAEFGRAKAAFLRAQAELNRWKWLTASVETGNRTGAVSRKEIIEATAGLNTAEVELAIARQTLLSLGMSVGEIENCAESKDTGASLLLRAPFDATVVELKAVVGELAHPDSQLVVVADLSRMVACLNLRAEDLILTEVGMPVLFQVDHLTGERFSGRITWISSSVDPKTRTGEAHAELSNASGHLRAGLFGQGMVALQPDGGALSIPTQSVQWDGCCNMVFVQTSIDTFEPRKVRLGQEHDGFMTIQAGLLPGERVVTQGSYLMKTEILKGSIGAGCCAEEIAGTGGRASSASTEH